MRNQSPEFWARVRTVNWILGGVGLASTLVYFLMDGPYETQVHSIPPPPVSATATTQSRMQGTTDPSLTLRRALESLQRSVDYLAFTGDSETLIGSSSTQATHLNRRELHAWDVGSGKKLWTRAMPGSVQFDSPLTALMPDQSSLVTVRSLPIWNPGLNNGDGGYRQSLHLELLDARTGRTQNQSDDSTRQETPRPPVSVDIAPDGRSVAVACPDRVVVWQVRRDAGYWKRRVLPRSGERRLLPISRAQFTADGKHLVVLSKGAGGALRRLPRADIWDATTGKRIRSVGERLSEDWDAKPFHSLSTMAALSPNRHRLVTFSVETRRFVLWDVDSGKRLVESPPVDRRPYDTCVDLKFLASRGMSRWDRGEFVAATLIEPSQGDRRSTSTSIVYWDTVRGRMRSTSADAWGFARTDAISSDGRLAATPTDGYQIHAVFLRDARTGNVIRALKSGGGL
ncbi:MAG: hypothetical protein V4671_16330 [Armatimonadota bacterium]